MHCAVASTSYWLPFAEGTQMHMQYYSGQEICSTCNNWKGLRVFDEGQFICSLREAGGNCGMTGGEAVPEATCRKWTLWEAILNDASSLGQGAT